MAINLVALKFQLAFDFTGTEQTAQLMCSGKKLFNNLMYFVCNITLESALKSMLFNSMKSGSKLQIPYCL